MNPPGAGPGPSCCRLVHCRVCLRPVLGGGGGYYASCSRLSRLDWHRCLLEQRPQPGPCYLTHPLPGACSRSSLQLSRSPGSRPRGASPGSRSLGQQRSPGAQRAASALLDPCRPPPQPQRWIGEETRRALPSHVYKYYLAQTREYRRQHLQVTGARDSSI